MSPRKLIPRRRQLEDYELKHEFLGYMREDVLQEIKHYRRALIRLSIHLNTFATPSRLPDELLCIRKMESAPDGPDSRFQGSQMLQTKSVALNFLPFWSHIKIMDNSKYTPCIEEFLVKSKEAPLHVIAAIHPSSRSVSLKVFKSVVTEEFHRIQSLDLVIPSINFNGKLFSRKNATKGLKTIHLVHYRNGKEIADRSILESLSLSGFDVDQIIDFLRSISFPTTTKLMVTLHDKSSIDSIDRRADLTPKTPAHLTSFLLRCKGGNTGSDAQLMGFANIRYLSNYGRTPTSLRLWINNPMQPGMGTYIEQLGTPDPDFGIFLRGATMPSFKTFCRNFTPLVHVHTLQVNCPSRDEQTLNPTSFARILSTLPNVWTLIITDTTEYNVAAILSSAFVSEQILVLETLVLRSVGFGRNRPDDSLDEEILADEDCEQFENKHFLAAHLAKRLELGGKIGRVVLNKCYHRANRNTCIVQELTPLVDVDWDGY
ncbi:hypothetical protein C8Q75DRAFT_895985 [Abortiporus biennis]|nr:hypothetical protein C8Q75DRAFT_895985 [Abortiporus biennis]